jgi:hypothetical protein
MRVFKLGLLAAGVLLLGVGAASANDTAVQIGEQLYILDGRVNSWDVAAPVAVYCQHESPEADNSDTDRDSLAGIELLAINASNNGELALRVDGTDIAAVGENPASATLLGSSNGYSLYRAPGGSFYVVAPPDEEGKVYSFVWEEGDPGC